MAREIACVTCGKTFTTTHSQAKFCPDVCRQLSLRRSWNKYSEKNRTKRKIYCRKHYLKNSEKILKRTNKRHKTEKGREGSRRSTISQRALYPEKFKARSLVRGAILKGELTRGKCEKCGDKKTHGHHDDYSKPLEVRWLCAKHHAQHHREERIGMLQKGYT